MEIFTVADYRQALKERVKSFKIPLNVIAEETRIHPSYLSRALLGKATLSSDQLFRIGTMLKLPAAEIDFILMLRERDETGDSLYRDYLDRRINETRRARLKLSQRLAGEPEAPQVSEAALAEYYRDALNAAVHMYLCISRFRRQPQLVARRLGISYDRLHEVLAVLERTGLIISAESGLSVRSQVIHLDEDSPFSRGNHINWRLEAIRSLQQSSKSESAANYSLSSCFSCREGLLPWIKERFKQFVADVQNAIVDDDGAEETYFMNFDLYELGRNGP